MDYKKTASQILEKVGGEKNILSVGHCATRLRFNLKDSSLADTEGLKKLSGVVGVVNKGGQYQVVIGNDVQNVHRALQELGSFNEDGQSEPTEKKGAINTALDTIAGIFFPIVPALAGAGMIKALLAILSATKVLTAASPTYRFLNFFGDAAFYFLPVLIASSASKKFKTNQFVAISLGAILLHPTFISMVNTAKADKVALEFIGLNVPLVSYGSSVIPIILIIWFSSYVERFAEKIVPKVISLFAVPMLTLLVTAPVALIAIAPLGNYLGLGLGSAIESIYAVAPWLVPTLVGALTPLMVMTGMHYGLIPIGINSLATTGIDKIAGPGMLVSNIAQGGASLAVAFRAKNPEVKQLASSVGFTAVLGITEPAMYGISLRFKKPLYAAMSGGALGGLFLGIFGVGRYAQVAPGLLALPSYIGPDGFRPMILAAIGCLIAFAASFAISFVLGIDEPEESAPAKDTVEFGTSSSLKDDVVYAPIKGDAVELSTVNDSAFAEGIIGKGLAIKPEVGEVYAPIDGTVAALFDTNHAIGIKGNNGSEILIHIGIDTVKLNGRHFTSFVKKDQQIKKGDLLMKFDMMKIVEEGYDMTTPVLITNPSDYAEILSITGKPVAPGDAIIKLAI